MNPLRPWQRRLLYSSFAVLLLTGIYWAMLHYGGLHAYVSEPFLMKLHGAAAMVLLVAIGSVLPAHVPTGWITKRSRTSGTTVLAGCAVLAITGYLLYYAGNETVRDAASYVHLALGVVLPLVFGAHLQAKSSRQPATLVVASQPAYHHKELAPWKIQKAKKAAPRR
jgi:hypothetical protein